jgi:hypothetical protein
MMDRKDTRLWLIPLSVSKNTICVICDVQLQARSEPKAGRGMVGVSSATFENVRTELCT